jgi:hypothetical protein
VKQAIVEGELIERNRCGIEQRGFVGELGRLLSNDRTGAPPPPRRPTPPATFGR